MAFSRRDLFWYCAGVLTVLVVGLLVRALNGPQSNVAPTAEVAPAAPATAPAQSAPSLAAKGSQAAGSMEEVLSRLEARLASQGGSDSDWELLAQSYEFVGRTADATLARAHQLPASAKAGAAQADASPDTRAPVPAAPRVSGDVALASALQSKVPEGLTLFIVAKSADSPGPPVAIVRTTTGRWPLSFTLDDSNAMMPGRTLSSAPHVTIEARVSRSGMASPQPGDFQSSVATIDPHQPKPVHIVIDHVIS
jgi:cytochrome c-type biogenesis protein CcmH